MALKHLRSAEGQRVKDSLTKFVLNTIAIEVGENNEPACIDYATISGYTGVPRKSVAEKVEKLIDLGLIERLSRNGASCYNLVFDAVEDLGQDTPEKKQKATRRGWVYVVGIQGDNLYKIGMTRRKPDSRICEFATKMPYKVDIVTTKKTNDAFDLERKLHGFYKDLRENGEWFRLADNELIDLLTYLDNLKE